MKWFDDVLAAVPADFVPETETLPEDATELGKLDDDLVPVARAWFYYAQERERLLEEKLRSTVGTLLDLVFTKPGSGAAPKVPDTTDVDALARKLAVLQAILQARLFEQYPAAEGVGTLLKDGAWVTFTVPDNRPTIRVVVR
jgi:hypothetical protein